MRISWRMHVNTWLNTWRPTGRLHTLRAATHPTLCSIAPWPRPPWQLRLNPSPTCRYRCSLPCVATWSSSMASLLQGKGNRKKNTPSKDRARITMGYWRVPYPSPNHTKVTMAAQEIEMPDCNSVVCLCSSPLTDLSMIKIMQHTYTNPYVINIIISPPQSTQCPLIWSACRTLQCPLAVWEI